MSEQPLIAVLDYGIGNLRSAQKALQHCGADARLTVDHGLIADADAVVLPGVGAFGACMAALRDADLEGAVEDAVESGKPFLGICVGMQMLFEASEEAASSVGLGIIRGSIRWLGSELPRPHMQWNVLTLTLPDDPMFTNLPDESWVYFVHSLHAVPEDPGVIAATCSYGGVVNAAFRRDNVFATQFHPEKSGAWGLAMLGNFVHIAAETSVR
jgi:imidazole glycerol-phosphate synthase subunit HisH